MGRQTTRQSPAVPRLDPLPATHWTSFEAVSWSGDPADRIDEVVVGPSGVHVVMHRPGLRLDGDHGVDGSAGDRRNDPDHAGDRVRSAAVDATTAAVGVARLLPARYHPAVLPKVCLCDLVGVGAHVVEVMVSSPEAVRHSLRHQPRVLSTSEAKEVAARLDSALTRCPPAARGAVRRHGRVARLWLVGLVAGGCATAVYEFGQGRWW